MEILGTTAWAMIPVIFGVLLTLVALIRDTELRSEASTFDWRVLKLLEDMGERIERRVSGSKIFGHLVQPTQMK